MMHRRANKMYTTRGSVNKEYRYVEESQYRLK